MTRWTNTQDDLPGSETECFLVVRIDGAYDTHKKLAQYCDGEWVDIDGETVENVEWWTAAPKFDRRLEILEKLRQCVENDKCERESCCYFSMYDEIIELLNYMRSKGGRYEEQHEGF